MQHLSAINWKGHNTCLSATENTMRQLSQSKLRCSASIQNVLLNLLSYTGMTIDSDQITVLPENYAGDPEGCIDPRWSRLQRKWSRLLKNMKLSVYKEQGCWLTHWCRAKPVCSKSALNSFYACTKCFAVSIFLFLSCAWFNVHFLNLCKWFLICFQFYFISEESEFAFYGIPQFQRCVCYAYYKNNISSFSSQQPDAHYQV